MVGGDEIREYVVAGRETLLTMLFHCLEVAVAERGNGRQVLIQPRLVLQSLLGLRLQFFKSGEKEGGTEGRREEGRERGKFEQGIIINCQLEMSVVHLLEIEVSRISKHFSFQRLGLPGICEWGMFFSSNISTNSLSALQ